MTPVPIIVGHGFALDNRKAEKKALVREAATAVKSGSPVIDAAYCIYDRYYLADWKFDNEVVLTGRLNNLGKAIRIAVR